MAALVGALLGGTARRVVGRAIGKVGGTIGRVIGRIGGNKTVRTVGGVVGAGAAAGAGAEAVSRTMGGGGGTSIGGLPLIVDAETVEVMRAPPGYVIITDPMSGEPIAMLREVAYALGLRKRPTKRGGISSKDIRTARRVQSVISSMTVNRVPRFKLKRKR